MTNALRSIRPGQWLVTTLPASGSLTGTYGRSIRPRRRASRWRFLLWNTWPTTTTGSDSHRKPRELGLSEVG